MSAVSVPMRLCVPNHNRSRSSVDRDSHNRFASVVALLLPKSTTAFTKPENFQSTSQSNSRSARIPARPIQGEVWAYRLRYGMQPGDECSAPLIADKHAFIESYVCFSISGKPYLLFRASPSQVMCNGDVADDDSVPTLQITTKSYLHDISVRKISPFSKRW